MIHPITGKSLSQSHVRHSSYRYAPQSLNVALLPAGPNIVPLVSQIATGEVRDQGRDSAIETRDVHRTGVIRIGDADIRSGHAEHGEPGIDSRPLAILAQRLMWMDTSVPRFVIGDNNDRVVFPPSPHGPRHGQ